MILWIQSLRPSSCGKAQWGLLLRIPIVPQALFNLLPRDYLASSASSMFYQFSLSSFSSSSLSFSFFSLFPSLCRPPPPPRPLCASFSASVSFCCCASQLLLLLAPAFCPFFFHSASSSLHFSSANLSFFHSAVLLSLMFPQLLLFLYDVEFGCCVVQLLRMMRFNNLELDASVAVQVSNLHVIMNVRPPYH